MTRSRFSTVLILLTTAVALGGCGPTRDKPEPETATAPAKPGASANDDVAVERAKLDPAERALVEAQEWCVENDEERLGSMGPPLKLDIKGQPVFVCCKGCKKKAESDPNRTLAKVEELKAKSKAEKTPKK